MATDRIDVSVTARFGDKPVTVYELPQHVLVPTFEEREDHWVGKLPFFGLFGYGKTRDDAGKRIVEILNSLATTHAKNVLEGRYTRETVLASAGEGREGGEG